MVRTAVILAACVAASPAAACRLALLLALDVSSSVDASEDQLQRNGLVAALTSPSVQAAFFALEAPVALGVYEWSGRFNQDVILDWLLIDSPAALVHAAETIAISKRGHTEFPTAIGYALAFGSEMLARGPRCLHQTIDVAGDGHNNDGFGPHLAYREFDFGDVTVNGLVINAAEFTSETKLIDFYRSEVLRGPGAFVEVAQGFEDYERAMRRKLERELTPPVLGAAPDEKRIAG